MRALFLSSLAPKPNLHLPLSKLQHLDDDGDDGEPILQSALLHPRPGVVPPVPLRGPKPGVRAPLGAVAEERMGGAACARESDGEDDGGVAERSHGHGHDEDDRGQQWRRVGEGVGLLRRPGRVDDGGQIPHPRVSHISTRSVYHPTSLSHTAADWMSIWFTGKR